eukprot:4950570-Pleurochrysis_carterae.AAC.1
MRTSVLSMWMTGYRAQHWLNDTEALSEFVAVLRCFWNSKDIEAAHSLLHATEVLHPRCFLHHGPQQLATPEGFGEFLHD